MTPNPDGSVAVIGTGMNADSRVFFDGLPAAVRAPFTGTEQSGFIVVQPPQGAHNQTAAVTVFNTDGLSTPCWCNRRIRPLITTGPPDRRSRSFDPTGCRRAFPPWWR